MDSVSVRCGFAGDPRATDDRVVIVALGGIFNLR
jgi:hypothetical protein